MIEQDSLGVYRIGDLKFYSKLEAIEMHAKTGIHPHWDFNEAVFSSYDWTKEPTETLDELYRIRAQQLRDKYDYVILSYSGGADSENILHTFLKHDIKLDEVVTMMNYEGTGDKDAWMNEEVFKTAIPYAQELQEQYHNFKHRIVDITQMQLDFWSISENKFDWIYEMNFCWNPNCVVKKDWVLKVKEWRDIIDSGKSLCVIHGTDKPRLAYKNGKLCFIFADLIDNVATVKAMSGQQPYADELFYWSPSLVPLMIKQAHVIKRYMSQPLSETPWVSTEKTEYIACKEHNDVKYWLTPTGLHYLIYPGWTPGKIVGLKPPSIIHAKRDYWFFDFQNEHELKKNYLTGLEKWWITLPDYWKNNPADITKGVKLSVSRSYFIE